VVTEENREVPGEIGESKRRFPEWSVVLGIGVLSALVYLIPYLQNPIFYYVGDNPESFVPLWHHLGEQLLSGNWAAMDGTGWFGGNYAGDAAYSVWNPVWLLNYVIVSLFDNLAAGAAFVMIEFLALLSMAAYLLAREYGSSRVPAAIVAIAVPGAGFTLYYEAAGWPSNLLAFTCVAWFWWATRRFARGAGGPLLPFVFGVLAATVGNPYAALGLVLVLLAIGVELLVRKDFRKLWQTAVLGACVGASLLLAFLPLLGAMPVSTRQELAAIMNDTFMVPDLGDLAGSSGPTYLPSITNWNGAVRETLPSTYFMWFAIPLLPWLRWRTLRDSARPLVSLGVFTALFAMAVVGPSNLWLFRWPIRLIEWLFLGLAIFLAVLLSAGLARDHIRNRTLATVALVVFGGYMSFAVTPQFWRLHFVAMVAVGLLVVGALYAYRRWGPRAFGAVLVVGTIGVVTYQSGRIPEGINGPNVFVPPHSVSAQERGTADYEGTVLQLASQSGLHTDDVAEGQILFGNESLSTGHEWINRYSGIGFEKFHKVMCMDYKGVTCPELYGRLWRDLPGTDVRLIDALRVQTLVLKNDLLPKVVDEAPPTGWREIRSDDLHTVWLREDPLPYPGRVSNATAGIDVTAATPEAEHEQVKYTATEDGKLMFARLAWPGYTATVDGKTVKTTIGPAGLIVVDVPAGTHTLELDYQAPGMRLGFYALGGATLVVLALSVFCWRDRRRERRNAPPPADPEGDTTGDDTMSPVLIHAQSPADTI
jgi:membrane protein YfhO